MRPIITNRQFLLNTKMAIVILHPAKSHKLKAMLLLTCLLCYAIIGLTLIGLTSHHGANYKITANYDQAYNRHP